MRFFSTLVAAVLVFAFVSGCGEENDHGGTNATVRSAILGQDREIIIHLPAGYDSTRSYNVAYVLDGSSQDGPFAEELHRLAAVGAAPEAIVVGIPNMSAENRSLHLVPPMMLTNPDDPNSPPGQGDRFLDFIKDELVPFIESRYRVSSVRAFVGHSRGGLVVLYSLMKHPDLFRARFCFSTPVWRQEYLLVHRTEEFLRGVDTLRTFLYLSAGANETENIRSGLERMRAILTQEEVSGLVWQADVTPDADHQNNARASMPAAIKAWAEDLRQ